MDQINNGAVAGCTISVEDEGIGIKAEELPFVFKAFFHTNDKKSQSLNANSHGIGLNLSLKLAKLLKGTLSVQSIHGSGSKFTLELGHMTKDKLLYFDETKHTD